MTCVGIQTLIKLQVRLLALSIGFVIRKVRTKNQSVKELANKTLVRPQVEYASTVFSLNTKKNINQIEMVQRKAARWLSNNYSPYDSVSAILSNLGWRSLEYRRYYARLAMLFFQDIPWPCCSTHAVILRASRDISVQQA